MSENFTLHSAAYSVVECVDLRRTFVGKYQFLFDPSDAVERSDLKKSEAAWLTRIPYRGGSFIAPNGGPRLSALAKARSRREFGS